MAGSREPQAARASRPVLAPPPATPGSRALVPTFSVVIAAYQAEAFVAEAVESALAQSAPPLEVIVCDDGSTDGTERALGAYRSRIVYLRRENGGEGAAKNTGAAAAKGDFVVFLDADDLFLPERLAALGELAAARPDLDVLTTDAYLELGGVVVRRCYDESWPFPADGQRAEILRRNFVFGHAAVERTVFRRAGGFDESLSHATDWDLWLRLVLAGSSVGLVAEPLSRYRLTPGSLSSHRSRLVAGRVRTLEKALRRADLVPADRELVRGTLETERRRLALLLAREAAMAGSGEARRLLLDVARERGQPVRTRLKALVAAAAPRLAGRRLAAGPIETTAGLVSPPPPVAR